MKKKEHPGRAAALCALLAALGLLSGCGGQKEEEHYAYGFVDALEVAAPLPAQPDPAEAVADWMERLCAGAYADEAAELLGKQWDPELAGAAGELAGAWTRQLEYRLGNAKTDGHRAEVDLMVTAPDLAAAVRDLAVQALGRAAVGKVLGTELPGRESLTEQVCGLLESGDYIKITRSTSVFLALGGDGQWKLDLSAPENVDFLTCLGGGLTDLDGGLLPR